MTFIAVSAHPPCYIPSAHSWLCVRFRHHLQFFRNVRFRPCLQFTQHTRFRRHLNAIVMEDFFSFYNSSTILDSTSFYKQMPCYDAVFSVLTILNFIDIFWSLSNHDRIFAQFIKHLCHKDNNLPLTMRQTINKCFNCQPLLKYLPLTSLIKLGSLTKSNLKK